MKKLFLKTLLFSCVFLFFNCQEDDAVKDAKQEHFEISIQRKSFNEFHDLPELVSKHAIGAMPESFARGNSTDPLYDFEIDSTSVTQIIKEGKTFYTMAIYREASLDNSFENLVISNEGSDNEAYIVKYFPSEEYLQSLETNTHAPFIGEINITSLDYSELMSRGQISCYTVTIAYCGNGPAGTAAGPGCYNHSDGGAHVFTRTYRVCKELPDNPTYISPDVPQSGGGGGSASPSTPIVTEPIILFAERQFVMGLSAEQKAWWNNPVNVDERQKLINYIKSNNSSEESKVFALNFINLLMTNSSVEFVSTYQGYKHVFANFSEFEAFVNQQNPENTNNIPVTNAQNKIVSTKVIDITSAIDIVVELVITPNPNFSLDEDNSTSFIDTLLPGNSWTQNILTVTNPNSDGNNAEITITGYILTGIKIGDFETGIKMRKKIILKINKNTGVICCVTISSL